MCTKSFSERFKQQNRTTEAIHTAMDWKTVRFQLIVTIHMPLKIRAGFAHVLLRSW